MIGICRLSAGRSCLAAVVAFALPLTGCYTTTLRSGAKVAPATVEYDSKWHHGFVLGIAEVSGPYDLHKACPNGWAQITTETSFLNGFVELVTSGIYAPQTVTVQCASEGPIHSPQSAPPPTEAQPTSSVAE
jgi:hypothetical protein